MPSECATPIHSKSKPKDSAAARKKYPNDQNRTGDQSISEDTENSINHYSRSLYHLSYARSRTPHSQHVLDMGSHTNDTASRHIQHITNTTRQVSSSYHAYSPQDIATNATLLYLLSTTPHPSHISLNPRSRIYFTCGIVRQQPLGCAPSFDRPTIKRLSVRMSFISEA